ncbi:MAG: hypothetical protein B7Y45_02875 [Sphingomonas sp. 28-66-16]|nr:MAG: hypothetical protein B7Y45_02875 [Sphingomonas sp. 28-66-16]
MNHLRKRQPLFQLIDRNMVDTSWNGIGMTLVVDQSVSMPQTPNGTTVFGWANQATLNNAGTLALTSGGSAPTSLDAPALAAQPGVLMANWNANNLNVTNISPNAQTPIWISLYGPGIPGQTSMTLKTDGTALGLATAQSAMATALPQYMRLYLTGTSPKLCIFAIIGGPTDVSGNNGYVIAVNASATTGPGTGMAPPPGYYATTTGNAYAFPFNWGSSKIYVVNMSPVTSSSAQVALSPL